LCPPRAARPMTRVSRARARSALCFSSAVLLLSAVGCLSEPEPPVVTSGDDVPDVTSAADTPGIPPTDTRVVPPTDTLQPTDVEPIVPDALELADAADATDVYQIPDCAVWITFPEPEYDGSLPVQPASSLQPCLCYPDGTSCTLYFHESCVWSTAPYLEDESARCPEGEVCSGDHFQHPGTGTTPMLGTCLRPCSHPDAAINAPFACASSEECVVARRPMPGAQLPCSPDGMEGPCNVPQGFRSCEDAWDSFSVAMCTPRERKQPYWDFSGCPPEDKPKPVFPVFPDASP